MDDAIAMAGLKMLKASDQIVERTIQAAEAIEDEAARTAPGSAAFLSGAGLVAAIQSQAMTQKLLAAELRQEAARLAHDNVVRKRSAKFTGEFQHETRQMFRR